MELESGSVLSKEDDQIELPPGFRFHPTDEELITHYLHKKVMDVNFSAKAIGEVDLNKSEPWDLPWKAKMGEKEWYFFCVRDRKYPTGLRTNRATEAGYWKATGKDKEIHRGKSLVGMKKTLVFYRGRAPKGEKTNWVMHEYRLEGKLSHHNLPKTAKNEWVISRIFEKSSGGKKTHISGLVRVEPFESDGVSALPPLMDSSSSSPHTAKMKPVSGPAYVPCFSNSIDTTPQRNKLETMDGFGNLNTQFSSISSDPSAISSNVLPRMPLLGSVYSPQTMSLPQNLQYPSPILTQDHSVLRALLGSNLKTEREVLSVAPETGLTSNMTNNNNVIPEISPVMAGFEFGRRTAFHHQQVPSTSGAAGSGPADLDFIWNY